MTKAEEIYEKHIGSNADLGYIPAIKQDILDAINEALSQHDVSVSVCDFVWHNSDIVTNLKCRECGSNISQY